MSGPFGPPPGYQQDYGRPSWAPSPAPPRASSGLILAVFVGAFVVVGLLVAVFVLASQPPAPVAPCDPAQPCAPAPSLPPVGGSPVAIATAAPHATPRATLPPIATPGTQPTPGASVPAPTATPTDNSPAVITGQLHTDDATGFSFEYDPAAWALSDTGSGSAVLDSNYFDCEVWIDVKTADTSPQQLVANELSDVDQFLVGRTADTDAYDALLGPEIGYQKGIGSVWSGTLTSSDGTPQEPGGVTILAATDGRITAAVVVIVGSPDSELDGDTQQYQARKAADDLVKTFNWGSQ